MNWVDYAILAVIAISALISLVRGFVREVLSIIVWVAAFWLALRFSTPLATVVLAPYIESPSLQLGAGFVIIFVATLLVGAAVNYFIVLLVGKTGLTGTDRTLGMVFGAARGLVVVLLLTLVLGLTTMPRERWWQESTLLAELTPWVCEVGVDGWLADITVFSPLASGVSAPAGKPAASYWTSFCTGTVVSVGSGSE